MKVVLFCGGLGLRLSGQGENTPKPMVPIGDRPILWHLMKYYAHFGHRDFILCLGHGADVIRQYFANYDAALSAGRRKGKQPDSDISTWSITFVDTGLDANVGMRLRAVREHLQGEEVFLANYSDNLTDAALPSMIDHLTSQAKVASFISVKPSHTFHVVHTGPDSSVTAITSVASCDIWINGGFFVFRRAIFDYLHEGEELVVEPFQRLIQENRLTAYRHDGFWACMDTFKEKMVLDDLYHRGSPPWATWKQPSPERPDGAEGQ